VSIGLTWLKGCWHLLLHAVYVLSNVDNWHQINKPFTTLLLSIILSKCINALFICCPFTRRQDKTGDLKEEWITIFIAVFWMEQALRFIR
jgi:competence protein ComGF